MTPEQQGTGALALEDVEQAMRSFAHISDRLLDGYDALSKRAEHVEAELCRTNDELERKVHELDAVKRHLEAILQSLPTGVVVRDAEERIVRANAAALAILGCGEDDLLGERSCAGLRGAEADGEAREIERPGSEPIVVASRYSPIVAAGGEQAGSVEILDDRTALTRMTERVHQLDKMAALGTVAGGIAHEIRNPMNAIMGFAALLAKRFEPGSKEADWANLIREGVNEADAIITSLLTFADPERLRLETVDPEALIDDAVAAVTRDLERAGERPARWEIVTRAASHPFVADRIKLRQAVRNLVANAVDAQPDGGRIEVVLAREGDDVAIRVCDAGPGIPAELAQKVREPFFTTRADGTGLGLALVHTIAQLHGGRLDIERRPSPLGGAAVILRFPFSTGSPSR
ncbi:MAG: PAS domain-containing protein [Planctomycetota bacterium]|nr:MAG: PAS domain-containing protein [Planctomycetota bacterium]